MSTISWLRNIWYVTSRPRTSPSRIRCRLYASRDTCQKISGTTNWAAMLGCALSCEIRPGANPQNAPPSRATGQLSVSRRENSQYHATAVLTGASMTISPNATAGPNSMVTGSNGRVSANVEVLATMFTPSGALSWWVNNGFSPCVNTRTAWLSQYSNWYWSGGYAASTRPLTCRHRCAVNHRPPSRYPPIASRSARRTGHLRRVAVSVVMTWASSTASATGPPPGPLTCVGASTSIGHGPFQRPGSAHLSGRLPA